MADNNVNRFSREDAANANNMAQAARSLTEELKDQLGIRSRLNETQRETLNLARQLQVSAQQNTVEIGNSGNIERQIAKDSKLNLNLRRELLDAQRDITEDIKIELDLLKEAGKLGDEAYIRAFQSASQETQKIALLQRSIDLSNALIQQRKEEGVTQQKINDKMGVTGALVKGTGALMERLGMRSGIFQDAMKESAEAMREMAEETVRGEAKFSKLQIMLKGFSKLAQGFGKALFDPFTIITATVSKALELNSASTKLQRLTGQVRDIQAAHNTNLASGAQIMTLMAEMTERTGIAASAIFSSEDLGRLAEAQNLLGLSSEQASNLGMFSKVSGTSIQGYKEELVASVNEFNAMNDSAVAHGVVMKDVLDASADISMSLGGNPGKIAAAASAARKLGLDLAKVNQIADGLLDFESSIESELEAQLLTGKNINLNKARELALNNDLEGVAKELAKNGASAAEFAKMNRIQQEGMAKALGMSREEMGKMLINQEGQKNLSKEQRAAMRGVTLEQLEQMEASESLQLAFSKIAEPLASILSSLTPIVTLIAKAVAFITPIGSYVMVGVLAFKSLATATQLATIKTGLLNAQTKIGNALTLTGNTIRGAAISLWNAESVAKFRSAAATKATAAAEYIMNGARQLGIVLQNTAIGRWIVEKAQIVASTVAKWANIGATSAQAAANSTLAASQTAVGSTGAAAGAGLGAFGAAAAPAVPILLAIGAALLMASPAIYAIGQMIVGLAQVVGNVLVKALEMIPSIIGSMVNGFSTVFTLLTQNIGTLFLMGPALFSIAAGLGAIALAGIAAIPALAALSGFALMATPLIALGGLFGDGGNEDNGMAELSAKLDTLISVVSAGGNVYLDGNKVGEAQVLGTYKLS